LARRPAGRLTGRGRIPSPNPFLSAAPSLGRTDFWRWY